MVTGGNVGLICGRKISGGDSFLYIKRRRMHTQDPSGLKSRVETIGSQTLSLTRFARRTHFMCDQTSMVATATPGLKGGNTPPLCHLVGVKHNTAGGHLALRGALKYPPYCCG
jgi:hypothetical protein